MASSTSSKTSSSESTSTLSPSYHVKVNVWTSLSSLKHSSTLITRGSRDVPCEKFSSSSRSDRRVSYTVRSSVEGGMYSNTRLIYCFRSSRGTTTSLALCPGIRASAASSGESKYFDV